MAPFSIQKKFAYPGTIYGAKGPSACFISLRHRLLSFLVSINLPLRIENGPQWEIASFSCVSEREKQRKAKPILSAMSYRNEGRQSIVKRITVTT